MNAISTVKDFQLGAFAICVAGLMLVCGCTSAGHEKRAVPQIAKSVGELAEVGFDPDDNELSVAVEKLLDARGIRSICSARAVRASVWLWCLPDAILGAEDTDAMSDVSPESLTKPINSAGQNNQTLPRFVDTIRSGEDQR